jgi:hypothetical protein
LDMGESILSDSKIVFESIISLEIIGQRKGKRLIFLYQYVDNER